MYVNCKCNLFTSVHLHDMEEVKVLVKKVHESRLKFNDTWHVGSCERRKTLRARTRTDNKLNPNVTTGPGIKPRSQWWEVSAITTALSLLSYN